MIHLHVRKPLHPITAAATAIAAAVCAFVPATASAASTQAVTNTWAGYVAHSKIYTSVSASWLQPRAGCLGTAASSTAFWVGLDGFTDPTVEQAGTEAVCTNDRAGYFAWYELYPANPVTLPNLVAPGDSITTTISAAKDIFTITIRDVTKGWTSTSRHAVPGAARTSAEVVLEAPAAAGVVPPTKGTVTFTAAKVDGLALGAANPTEFNSTYASCGALIGGTRFTCTWE